jgi:hypothetical protein
VPRQRTPPQPSRTSLPPEDQAAYDSVVARQRSYDYESLVELYPAAHREAVETGLLRALGG